METPKRVYNLISDRQTEILNENTNTQLKYESFSVGSLPSKIDLRLKLPPIIDQGSVGSCTACAISAAFQYCDPSWIPSELFIYYNTRMLDNNVNTDSGTTISQTVNSIVKYGACNKVNWPYNVNSWSTRPTKLCYTEALDHQALNYSHIQQTYVSMKSCLASGFPFVIGIFLWQSFESSSAALTGFIPIPDKTKEQYLGGHAVLCCGYDDDKKVWIMRNSWGPRWGDKGYFYVPYSYLEDMSNVASDSWKITLVETVKQTDIQNKIVPKIVKGRIIRPPIRWAKINSFGQKEFVDIPLSYQFVV